MNSTATSVDALSINTIRFLAVDAVEKAKSGHPGTPTGADVIWAHTPAHSIASHPGLPPDRILVKVSAKFDQGTNKVGSEFFASQDRHVHLFP